MKCNYFTSQLKNLLLLPSNKLLSPLDNIIQVWDCKKDYEPTFGIEGHTGYTARKILLQNGNLASGSDDTTIRLWDCTYSINVSECLKNIRLLLLFYCR
jgi:WD40 repeat protein